jgi:hypothetical protein
MRVSPRFLAWTALWAVILAAMWFGGRAAGRAFDDYMDSGDASAATALAALPAEADGFVFEPDPVARWRLFRRWKLDASLQEFSRLRPLLENWGLGQPKVTPLEGLLLHFWPKNLAVAWSAERGFLWFAAPVGNRWETGRWLADLFLRSPQRPEKCRVERDGGQWWVDVEDPRLLPEGRVAQLAVVRGIAVLAIGPRGSSPLAPVLAPSGPGIASDPEAAAALEGALRPDAGPAGIVRIVRPGHVTHTLSWRLTPEGAAGDEALSLDLRLPSCRATAPSAPVPGAARLGALAQPDDIVAVVGARPDLAALAELCGRALPPAMAARLGQAGPGWIPEAFRPAWEPVFKKLGDEVFVGVGGGSSPGERARPGFPRAVVAIPMEDPAAFLSALEQTILRCNREQNANMVIRKRTSASGDVYRVAGGEASWKRQFGLAEFGFAKGLLLLAPDSATLEKAMERASSEAAAGDPARGVRLRASLPRVGAAFRGLVLAAGALLGGDQTETISPSTLKWMDEALAALRNFGEARADLEREPGAWRLRARLAPARQP